MHFGTAVSCSQLTRDWNFKPQPSITVLQKETINKNDNYFETRKHSEFCCELYSHNLGEWVSFLAEVHGLNWVEGGDGDCGICLDRLKELSSVCVGLDLSNKIHQLGTFVCGEVGEGGWMRMKGGYSLWCTRTLVCTKISVQHQIYFTLFIDLKYVTDFLLLLCSTMLNFLATIHVAPPKSA